MIDSLATKRVLQAVKNERDRQEQIHGEQSVVNLGTEWGLVVLQEEVGEVAEQLIAMRALGAIEAAVPAGKFEMWLEHRRNLRIELVQVAAVAVALVEGLDRS